jgi:glycosyltransferase involved in cell wall biosynthesis
MNPPISVVIPAHNEEAVIGRLLSALGDVAEQDEIVVVCDGCTDATADMVRTFAGIRVIKSQTRRGKAEALNTGDLYLKTFPRFYVDADIVVSLTTLRQTAEMMNSSAPAGAPRMAVDTRHSSWPVRCFYDIWTRLPYATTATLGSGVFGLTREGRSRFDRFPQVIGDDEFIRRMFPVSERAVSANGSFVVTAPRRVMPLIRIKTRSRLGVLQLNRLMGHPSAAAGAPGRSVLGALCRDSSRWIPLLIFSLIRGWIGVSARIRFIRGKFDTWDRDESARSESTS